LVCRVPPLDDPLADRLGFHRPLVLVAGEKDSGRKPIDPLGTPSGPAGRDGPGPAVLPVVYDAATCHSDHHQEAHNGGRRPHGQILPDSGF
jgi:hypothetical protein